jgi:hypothetical protein
MAKYYASGRYKPVMENHSYACHIYVACIWIVDTWVKQCKSFKV